MGGGGGGFRCITEFSLAEAEAVTTSQKKWEPMVGLQSEAVITFFIYYF